MGSVTRNATSSWSDDAHVKSLGVRQGFGRGGWGGRTGGTTAVGRRRRKDGAGAYVNPKM